jgi:hypothetical protein
VANAHFAPQGYGLLIALAVALAIILLRNRRPRPLRVERLWVRPVLFIAILATTVAAAPPPLTAPSLVLLATALAGGCALGWQRGRLMRIEVDPATHDLTSRASPSGLVFIAGLILARLWMRTAMAQGATLAGVPATAAADALIALAGGMMITQNLEMWLRARRLLTEAIAARNRSSP